MIVHKISNYSVGRNPTVLPLDSPNARKLHSKYTNMRQIWFRCGGGGGGLKSGKFAMLKIVDTNVFSNSFR